MISILAKKLVTSFVYFVIRYLFVSDEKLPVRNAIKGLSIK